MTHFKDAIAKKEDELIRYEQSVESVREKIKKKSKEVQVQNSRLQVKTEAHFHGKLLSNFLVNGIKLS